MIVEMALRFDILKARNNKFRWLDDGRLQCRYRIRCDQGFILIIGHLHDLHFIMATTIFFMHLHATDAAFLRSGGKETGRCQSLHAVMIIHHHSAGNHEVTKRDYGEDDLFHEPG